MSFGKGIPLASGFDFGAKLPLDSRYSVNTIEERDAHVTNNRVYEGMLVYVISEETLYKYSNGMWDMVPTKEYIDEMLKNVDLEGEDCWHVGKEQPENDELIWFNDNTSSVQSNFTYDNPIIQEIFSAIQSLQSTVAKLQEDVEYIKIHGGGSGNSSDSDNEGTATTKISAFELEDDGYLLLENGDYLLLENAISTINEAVLLLENGAKLLLEDGSSMKLE